MDASLSHEQQRERDLWADVFNPHESDREYFERRKRQLEAERTAVKKCPKCGVFTNYPLHECNR